MLGQIIGRYRIVDKLGQGGMGAVYAAVHETLETRVAVKVLHAEFLRDELLSRRFVNEAKAAAKIRHPGIVRIIDVGRLPRGELFILMELLDGESLQQRLKRERKLPEHTAASFIRQAAHALSAAHALGIVHRDLKPDNIFLIRDPEVDGGERVKLLDFGIAKLTEADSALVTGNNILMGTPPYMSPEQCRGAGQVDFRTDLYSLGVIFFEMLCGRRPFVGRGSGDYIAAHLTRPPPPVHKFNPNASILMTSIVAKLLAKNPDDRYASADMLVKALEATLQVSGSVRAHKETSAPVIPALPPTRPLHKFDPALLQNDVLPRDIHPRDALPHDVHPHDALRENALPHDALPHDALPRDALPRDALPHDALPQDALRENALREGVLKAEVLNEEFADTSGYPAATGNPFPPIEPATMPRPSQAPTMRFHRDALETLLREAPRLHNSDSQDITLDVDQTLEDDEPPAEPVPTTLGAVASQMTPLPGKLPVVDYASAPSRARARWIPITLIAVLTVAAAVYGVWLRSDAPSERTSVTRGEPTTPEPAEPVGKPEPGTPASPPTQVDSAVDAGAVKPPQRPPDGCGTLALRACVDRAQALSASDQERDHTRALALYRDACDNLAHGASCLQAAIMIADGRGATASSEQASAFYRKAATLLETLCQKRRDGFACEELAYLYEEGLGVGKVPKQANMLFGLAARHHSAACKRDVALSCFRLSEMHAIGYGVKQPSRTEAKAMRERACKLGHKPACTQGE